LLQSTGQSAGALAALEQERAIRQDLADANPNVAEFQFELAFCKSAATVVKIGRIGPIRPQIALAHSDRRSI